MPGLLQSSEDFDFKTFQVQKLHQTFGAQINGVDFSFPVSDEMFNEILRATNQVRLLNFRQKAC
jgi:alpha-ketoglutarate-dependent 2,4-dichlorophenoxyacetate dioxygenase